MWRSETRFNLEFQERHFAADFFEFGRSGRVHTREAIVRHESVPIHMKFPLDQLAIRRLDEYTIQATYNSIEMSAEKGGTEILRARRGSIWIWNGDDWVMRFHQCTSYDTP